MVQQEIKKRKGVKGYKTSGSPFSGKIICGECGSFYGSKVWHSTSKYRRVIWQCNSKFKNDKKCSTPHLYEDKIKQAFIEAFNSLIENKEEILESYETIIQELTDFSKLDKEGAKLKGEFEDVTEMLKKCVEENSHTALDQVEYEERYRALAIRYENVKKGLGGIDEKKLERSAKQERSKEFIKELKQKNGLITEFDEELWNGTVEKIIVNTEEKITFVFKNSMELEWGI